MLCLRESAVQNMKGKQNMPRNRIIIGALLAMVTMPADAGELDKDTLHVFDTLAICETDACPNPRFLGPCEWEDSDNCFWDARNMGNGIGESFYMLDGQRHVITYGKDESQ